LLYSVLMTSTQPTQRLVALDGVRGLAIILVILTHIPLGVLYSLPEFLHPLWTILLANGKTGVSLLFLLSGFLMTWLYPTAQLCSRFLGQKIRACLSTIPGDGRESGNYPQL